MLLTTAKLQGHYCDVLMSTMTSQITGVSIVCSTVCSGADQRKHQSSASLILFPSQRASNTENVSIWWRHHGHSLFQHIRKIRLHTFQQDPVTVKLKSVRSQTEIKRPCNSIASLQGNAEFCTTMSEIKRACDGNTSRLVHIEIYPAATWNKTTLR